MEQLIELVFGGLTTYTYIGGGIFITIGLLLRWGWSYNKRDKEYHPEKFNLKYCYLQIYV